MFQMDTQSKPAAVGLPLEAAWAPQSPLHSHTSALMHEPLLNDVPLAAVMQALGQLAVASDAPVSMSTNGGGSSLLHSRARFSQPTGDARLPRGSQYGGLDTNALRHAYSMPSMGWSSPQPSFTSPLLQNMDPSTLASLLSAPAAPDRHQATACEELLLAGLAPLNPQSRMPGSPNQQPSSPNSLYKTELCRTWQETGSCRYGGKCQFAHGCEELRPVQRHPKYKTEICRTFATTGTCPYGTRCRFIHYYAKPTACTGLPLQPMRDQTQLPRAASSTYGGRIDRSQSPGLGNGFGQGLGNMLLGHEVEIMLMQAQAHQAAGGSQEIYMPPLPPTSSSGTLAGLPSLTCTPSFDSHGGAPSPLNAATNIAPYDSTRLPVFKNFTPE